MFQTSPTRRRPRDAPGHAGGTMSFVLGSLLASPNRAGGGVWEEGNPGVFAETAAPRPSPWTTSQSTNYIIKVKPYIEKQNLIQIQNTFSEIFS